MLSLLSLLLLQQLSVKLTKDQSEAHKLMHRPCKACKKLCNKYCDDTWGMLSVSLLPSLHGGQTQFFSRNPLKY